MSSLRRFEIDTTPGGEVVKVDGQDVPAVRTVTVDLAAGELPRVMIEQYAASMVTGEAMIEFEGADSPADAVRNLDPADLRARVAGAGLSAADDLYASCIDAIADMLDEPA